MNQTKKYISLITCFKLFCYFFFLGDVFMANQILRIHQDQAIFPENEDISLIVQISWFHGDLPFVIDAIQKSEYLTINVLSHVSY